MQYHPCPVLGQVESTVARGVGTGARSLGSRPTFIKQVGLCGRKAETVSKRETRLWFGVKSLDPTEANVPSSHVPCGHSPRVWGCFWEGSSSDWSSCSFGRDDV